MRGGSGGAGAGQRTDALFSAADAEHHGAHAGLADTADMPAFRLVPAQSLEPERLHAAFVAAFADYLIGPFDVALAGWTSFLARQGIDLPRSRAAIGDEGVLAFALVAPRPDIGSWRLGTMGALPAARGSGAAPALLDDFLARAGAAGAASVELECFAQNTRALRLYQSRGFEAVDALHGWQHPGGAGTGATPPRPQAAALEHAFDWLDASTRDGLPLPLQVTATALRPLTVSLQAWQMGRAQVMFSQAASGRISIHSLVHQEGGQAVAEVLVAALLAHHVGHAVHVPPLQRDAVGGEVLQRLGFGRLPMHQWWMRRGV